MSKFISTGQAAKLIGVSDDSVIRHAIRQGTLKAQKVGRNWIIDEDDFHRWLEQKPHGKKIIKPTDEDRK